MLHNDYYLLIYFISSVHNLLSYISSVHCRDKSKEIINYHQCVKIICSL